MEQNAIAKAKNGITKSRNWFLMSYLSHEMIMDYLNLGNIEHYALIRHDKEECEPHYHILIKFKYGRTKTALQNDFKIRNNFGNTFYEPVGDVFKAYRYLTHKDDADKYQYEDNLIESDNPMYWESWEQGEEPDKGYACVADIINGKNPVYLMKKYGRDFILNCDKYLKFAQLVGTTSEQEFDFIQEEARLARLARNRETYELNYGIDERCYECYTTYDEYGNIVEPCYDVV